MDENGFLFFYDWAEPLSMLPGDEFKKIVLAMLEFQRSGIMPETFDNPMTQMVASFVFPQLKRRKEISETRKRAISKRWNAKPAQNDANEIQSDTNEIQNDTKNSFVSVCINSENTNAYDKDKDKTKTETETKTIDIDKDKDKDKDRACAREIALPFADGVYAVRPADLEEYKKRYGSVDVFKAFARMEEWLNKNAKPLSEAKRFISGWLKGENERAKNEPADEQPADASHDPDEFFKKSVENAMKGANHE